MTASKVLVGAAQLGPLLFSLAQEYDREPVLLAPRATAI